MYRPVPEAHRLSQALAAKTRRREKRSDFALLYKVKILHVCIALCCHSAVSLQVNLPLGTASWNKRHKGDCSLVDVTAYVCPSGSSS